jgi:hypothetical protein
VSFEQSTAVGVGRIQVLCAAPAYYHLMKEGVLRMLPIRCRDCHAPAQHRVGNRDAPHFGAGAFADAGRIFSAARQGLARMRDTAERSPYCGRITGTMKRLLCLPRAKSYSGENVVSLLCTGALVAARVLRLCLGAGAVPAGRGIYEARFLNGRRDHARPRL